MTTTATLTAEADPGQRGQQFIATITGRDKSDRNLRYALVYLGRRESGTTHVQASPGLYLVRDVRTSKGMKHTAVIEDRCIVVWMDGTSAVVSEIADSQALDIAKQLDHGTTPDWSAIGRAALIAWHEERLDAIDGKPDDMSVNLKSQIGDLPPGPSTYGAVRAARRTELARLRGESPARPIEIDALPSDPAHRRAALEAERARLLARLAELDAELGKVPS